jgi:hypothetical protein
VIGLIPIRPVVRLACEAKPRPRTRRATLQAADALHSLLFDQNQFLVLGECVAFSSTTQALVDHSLRQEIRSRRVNTPTRISALLAFIERFQRTVNELHGINWRFRFSTLLH